MGDTNLNIFDRFRVETNLNTKLIRWYKKTDKLSLEQARPLLQKMLSVLKTKTDDTNNRTYLSCSMAELEADQGFYALWNFLNVIKISCVIMDAKSEGQPSNDIVFENITKNQLIDQLNALYNTAAHYAKLQDAIKSGKFDVAIQILDSGVLSKQDIDQFDRDRKESLLYYALTSDSDIRGYDLVEKLRDAGANCNIIDNDINRAEMLRALSYHWYHNPNNFSFLLYTGSGVDAVINQPDAKGNTLLHDCIIDTNPSKLNILLENKTLMLDHANNNNQTPLIIALHDGRCDRAKLLLDKGALANLPGDTSESDRQLLNLVQEQRAAEQALAQQQTQVIDVATKLDNIATTYSTESNQRTGVMLRRFRYSDARAMQTSLLQSIKSDTSMSTAIKLALLLAVYMNLKAEPNKGMLGRIRKSALEKKIETEFPELKNCYINAENKKRSPKDIKLHLAQFCFDNKIGMMESMSAKFRVPNLKTKAQIETKINEITKIISGDNDVTRITTPTRRTYK